MEAGGSRAALKRARKKQNKARPPQPERRDPPPAAASSDQLVGKKRDKRKDFCRNKGDIPTYGNFANFKHIAVLNHINLAATGH